MEKIKFTKGEIKDKFIELVKEYGKNGILFTFEYCSNYGVELECSTIDEIQSFNGDVIFVYNANVQGEWDYLEQFSMDDLICFYNGLIDAIEEDVLEEETVETYENQLK